MSKRIAFHWGKRRRRDVGDDGAAAVEFAIIMPFLVLLTLGIVDYGSLMNMAAGLFGAARAGAEYAGVNWNNPKVNASSGTQTQVCTALGLTMSGGACSPVTPAASRTCTCVDGTSVTCPSGNGQSPCLAKVPGDPRVLSYVSVSATETYSAWLASSFFSFQPFSGQAVVRTQ